MAIEKDSSVYHRQYLVGSEEFKNNNRIIFTAFAPPHIDYLSVETRGAIDPGGAVEGSYAFYFPANTIREDITHNYSEAEGTIIEKLRSAKGSIANTVKTGEAILSKFNRNISNKTASHGLLTEEPTFFSNSEKRKFNIVLNLYYFEDIELEVYKPIEFFKKYSHATRDDNTGIGLPIINFPSTFTIKGGVFNKIFKAHLVLRSMSVEYNPEQHLLDSNGLPVHAQLSLDFEEIQTLFREDIEREGSVPFRGRVTETSGKKP